MQTIKDGEQVLALVYKNDEWPVGLNFFTPDDYFIQAGTWRYAAGKQLAAHSHKQYERKAHRTQELIYIKVGKLKVSLYREDRQLHSEFILDTGDLAVMVNGGHGYEILEADTQVLEVKNGPFTDVNADKDKF